MVDICHFGGVAQLGERLPCTQEVIGSIPFTSTKKYSFILFVNSVLKSIIMNFLDLNLFFRLFFDNLVIKSIKKKDQHNYENYFVAKLSRANGGCLGVKRR
uniref:Uncharacterized protein n=1 Tax=uncultured Desulfobacterium sp. TaxID=201089 RepID=E1YDC3_9BACT|nr:unknown protein [uncultured Desulfobacterium sp.]